MNRFALLVLSVLAMALGSGCASIEFRATKGVQGRGVTQKIARPANVWSGDVLAGPPSIVVDLSEQEAYFYKGKKLAGQSQISTGRIGFETPPGDYRIQQKDLHHVSTLYGDYVDGVTGEVVKRNATAGRTPCPPGAIFRGAKMPYFMRIKAGYGLHAGYLPGFRASHGCIRMPRDMAAHFYEASFVGTPVKVTE